MADQLIPTGSQDSSLQSLDCTSSTTAQTADQSVIISPQEPNWLEQCQCLMRGADPPGDNIMHFCKVLPHMRHGNNSEFNPIFFTFGPYHAKFQVPLSSCDYHKVLIAKRLTNEQSFNCLVTAISNRDRDIRRIYGELCADGKSVDTIESKDLHQLLALDALTIVGAAVRPTEVLQPSSLGPVIWRDAMLLEQQLPLFILQAAIDNMLPRTDQVDQRCSLEEVVRFYAVGTSYPFCHNNVKKWEWFMPIRLEQSMLGHIHCTFLGSNCLTSHKTGRMNTNASQSVDNSVAESSATALAIGEIANTILSSANNNGSNPEEGSFAVGGVDSLATAHTINEIEMLHTPEAEQGQFEKGMGSTSNLSSADIKGSSPAVKAALSTVEKERLETTGTESTSRQPPSTDQGGSHSSTQGSLKAQEVAGRLQTATKLQRCGIHFKVGDGGFTGISFDTSSRELTLPEIAVYDHTKPYLLNLVAHEAMISVFYDDPCPVSSYILLMDYLIDTEEDVRLLVDSKVIKNHLGSDAMLAEMWNTLAVNLPISHTKEDQICMDSVQQASHNKFKSCWAGFSDIYCVRQPWLLFSILAAGCLFILALLQTIFSGVQLHQYRGRS